MEPTFSEKTYHLVKQIPPGKVATYGDIAAYIGSPRAARQVGFALRRLGGENTHVPWWRVLNAKGYLSIRGHTDPDIKTLQAELLFAEGITVSSNFTVDLAIYRWRPQQNSA